MITVVCYRQKEKWSSKKNALLFYKAAMNSSDGYSSEFRRYSNIVNQLKENFKFAYDFDGDEVSEITEDEIKQIIESKWFDDSAHDEKWRMMKIF